MPKLRKTMISRFLLMCMFATLQRMIAGCTAPRGVDFGNGCTGSGTCLPSSDFSGLPDDSIIRHVIQKVNEPEPGLHGIETPVVNHWTASNMGQLYSAMAAYEPRALELWGRRTASERRRRCRDGIAYRHFLIHRKITIAYTAIWVFSYVHEWKVPAGGAEVPLRELASEWGLDFDICHLGADRSKDKADNCDDHSTPWGLALELVTELSEWFKRDGWNRNGDLGGGSHNLVRYSDWRSEENRYTPVNGPWTINDETRWQPLLEDNRIGELFHQEHVTPHIGETAVSIFFENAEICRKSAELSNPQYNLDREAANVLKRTAKLNDRLKARIELFDNKLKSLAPMVAQFYGKRGMGSDSFSFILGQVANVHAIREATILSWRSKVEHDLIRPPSYIHEVWPEKNTQSYGGPAVRKTVRMKGKDWQAYKRVMPHAEFPSGSSCVCRAFSDAMTEMTGVAEFEDLPIELIRAAGSSTVEKGKPEEEQKFLFSSWEQVVHECGESRLDGGMHFRAAVPAGEELCDGIGATVARAIKDLAEGKKPEYLVDFKAPPVGEVRCP